MYNFNRFIEISGNISRSKKRDIPDVYYKNPILTGLNFSLQNYSFGVHEQQNLHSKISCQYPLKSIQIYFTKQLSWSNKDNITHNTILDNGQIHISQFNYRHSQFSQRYRIVSNQ